MQQLVDQFRHELGKGPHWAVGFYDQGRWVGSAVISAGDQNMAARHNESQELEALLSAAGLALGGALQHAETDRLAEELACANQELVSAQEALLRQKSLNIVGEMAAGAAHELNNPLAVVSGRSQLLMNRISDEEVRAALEVIHKQAHRCSEIVSELMSFAKPNPPQPESIKLAGLISRLKDRWTAKYRLETDQIEVRIEEPDATVWADPSHLTEVFDEIVANAAAAMEPEGGKLIVNCPCPLTDDNRTLEFVDNGCGMDPDVLEHALDPFFSHRPAGRGRGLGLSRAYRLVEINGGTLHLSSRPAEGTRVTIGLPSTAA
jgi:signal transduction histidine kinase